MTMALPYAASDEQQLEDAHDPPTDEEVRP